MERNLNTFDHFRVITTRTVLDNEMKALGKWVYDQNVILDYTDLFLSIAGAKERSALWHVLYM